MNGCGGARSDCPIQPHRTALEPVKGEMPRTYSPEKVASILARLERGESLSSICRTPGMPPRPTFASWVTADVDGLADRYARARDAGREIMADEIVAIADEAVGEPAEVQAARLRVDARKWILSKRLPRTYGDKITQEHTGPGGGPVRLVWGDGSVE
jgi:transposase-like protein